MAIPALVYVHGAGPQPPASTLKRELDIVLFGAEQSPTRVARYAHVRWPTGPGGRGLAAGPAARRERAIRSVATAAVSPRDAARAIVAATGRPTTGRGMAIAPAGRAPEPHADAVELVERLYRRADRIAARSSRTTPDRTLGLSFPDPIFRIVVGRFASDVIDYLYGRFAVQMREPVREAIRMQPAPEVIVAHSLGTIVLYDVLNEPEFAELKPRLLLTAGSPLGIGNVQDKLRDRAGRPHPVPAAVEAWANFADRWDPVALEATLHDEFHPADFVRDERVNNLARNNHDLTGYLSIPLVRTRILEIAS